MIWLKEVELKTLIKIVKDSTLIFNVKNLILIFKTCIIIKLQITLEETML